MRLGLPRHHCFRCASWASLPEFHAWLPHVILEKLLNTSKPQFPHPENGDNTRRSVVRTVREYCKPLGRWSTLSEHLLLRPWVPKQDVATSGLNRTASLEDTRGSASGATSPSWYPTLALTGHIWWHQRPPPWSPESSSASVPLAEAQGSLLSLLPSFGSSLVFADGSDGKEPACNAGDPGSIPGLGRSPGQGNGYPLQFSCLKNSMDRGAWWAPWGHKESDTTEPQTPGEASFQPRAEGFNTPSHGLKTTRHNFTLGISRSRILAAQNQSEGGNSNLKFY